MSAEVLSMQPTRLDQLAQGVFDRDVQHRFQFRDPIAGRSLVHQHRRRIQ